MIEKYKNKLIQLALVAAMAFVLSFMLFTPVSAQNYNQNTYGSGNYGGGQTENLNNTGQPLAYLLPAGLILVGTFALFKTRKSVKSRKPNQEDESE